MWWVCITCSVSRALHTDGVEVSLTGRVGAPAAPNGSCLLCKKLLLYRIANNSILFSAVHHAQHAHTVKPRIRPMVGTRLAASPGLPPYPIAGCRAYSGATRSVHYTSDHHHAAVWHESLAMSNDERCEGDESTTTRRLLTHSSTCPYDYARQALHL